MAVHPTLPIFQAQRVRDPLHNLIEFKADQFESTLWQVINTRPFQRLRRVKQLGFSDLVYPGATHSRFSHSVGVFHTARQLMEIIRRHLGEHSFMDTTARAAIAAALVHDLGHGPFSHAFEAVGERLQLSLASEHEKVTDLLIRESEISEAFAPLGSGFANDVADVIQDKPQTHLYGAVVSSQFDADRLDYMRRDRLLCGSQHAGIDFEWMMANLEIGTIPYGVDDTPVGNIETFVIGPKAINAAEAYVLGLFQLYPTVYFHKATRGAEKIFSELLVRVYLLNQDGSLSKTGLPNQHPLAKFCNEPEDIENIISLDDSVIWGSLSLLAEADDAMTSELATRLRDRKLYKCIDVRERVKGQVEAETREQTVAILDSACEAIFRRVDDWLEEREEPHRILQDRAKREPYKKLQESDGPLNQIMVKTQNGELVDLGKRSHVVQAIQPFRLHRLYVREEDGDARNFLDGIIQQEIQNADRKASKGSS